MNEKTNPKTKSPTRPVSKDTAAPKKVVKEEPLPAKETAKTAAPSSPAKTQKPPGVKPAPPSGPAAAPPSSAPGSKPPADAATKSKPAAHAASGTIAHPAVKPQQGPPSAKTAPKTVKETEKAAKATASPKPPLKIAVVEGMDLKAFCEKAHLSPKTLLDRLSAKGMFLAARDLIEEHHLGLLSQETGFEIEWLTVEEAARREADSHPEKKIVRPPVVTIMGHVDHGKTTLLDAIRASNLVDKEFGGITQHIGAYQVKVGPRLITFIDTPGHEAFTRLRSRGARVTDLVVLVVAADEGLMPQTREAISHARAANVPILVAINKIDKPEANADRVKQQLSKEGLLVEEWGGQVVSVEVSAKEKKNIKELLEMILLVADLQEIKGHPAAPAQGVVLEARLDPKKGPLATVLVQQGVLSTGASFIAGATHGKIRALFDENGRPLKAAGMSMPVEILGFADVPQAGETLQVVADQEEARRISEVRRSRRKKTEPDKPPQASLDELFKRIEEGVAKDLSLVVKADVQGSVEVLQDLMPGLSTDRVKIKILHAGTGAVTESDILLASASKAVVLGYNVKASPKTLELARQEQVEVRTYSIIYQLIDDLKNAVTGMLEPVVKETLLGRADVEEVFVEGARVIGLTSSVGAAIARAQSSPRYTR